MENKMDLLGAMREYRITKPIRLIELFAGYGSQALALRYLGVPFEHHFVCEFDSKAIRSYNAVHGTSFGTSSVTDVTAVDMNITDTDRYDYIMTYSFPCTSLSTAGKQDGMREGSGTASSLLWEVKRLLSECHGASGLPQTLVMENVPQVVSDWNLPVFREWYGFLESLGYQSFYRIINGTDYGCPQARVRCIMVSFLGTNMDRYMFPESDITCIRQPTYRECLETGDIDSSFYLRADYNKSIIRRSLAAGLISWDELASAEFPATAVINRRGMDRKFLPRRCMMLEHIGTQVANTLVSSYGCSAGGSGDNAVIVCDTDHMVTPPVYSDGAVKDIRYSRRMHDFIDRYTNPPKLSRELERQLDNYYVRWLTPLECFRLMGVHDDDARKMMAVNKPAVCVYQAGNSILVPVLMNVFKRLIDGC